MNLRPYQPEDLLAVVRLFHETVHQVNQADYTEEQLEAWAPATPDLRRWQDKLGAEEAVVAEFEGEIVGFCSWDETGTLDFLYVHHAHQRKGIATALYQAAERSLKARSLARIQTQSSTTAQPFFAHQGFHVVKEQTVMRNGVALPNAVTEKSMPGGTADTNG